MAKSKKIPITLHFEIGAEFENAIAEAALGAVDPLRTRMLFDRLWEEASLSKTLRTTFETLCADKLHTITEALFVQMETEFKRFVSEGAKPEIQAAEKLVEKRLQALGDWPEREVTAKLSLVIKDKLAMAAAKHIDEIAKKALAARMETLISEYDSDIRTRIVVVIEKFKNLAI